MLYNWHRDYDPAVGGYKQFDPSGLRGGINGFAYVGGSPLSGTDRQGLFVDETGAYGIASAAGSATGTSAAVAGGAVAVAVAAAGAVGVGIGMGFNAAWEHFAGQDPGGSLYDFLHPSSDPDLQRAIEQEANKREYKSRCSEPPPPSLNQCERAKWNLNKAKVCKALRNANTNRWWGGVDTQHNAQLAEDLDNAIRNAQQAVDRSCKCP